MKNVQGGFGSAGAGNRTGGHTWTAVGRNQTAWARQKKGDAVVELGDPTREQLAESIRVGQCWWCKREGFKFIASHWSQAHGIPPQHARDLLGVPKHVGFLAPEIREQKVATARRIFDRDRVWAGFRGRPHQLSEHGERAAVERTERLRAMPLETRQKAAAASKQAYIDKHGPEAWQARLRRMSDTSAKARTKDRVCVVCAAVFQLRDNSNRGKFTRKTCYAGDCEKAYRAARRAVQP